MADTYRDRLVTTKIALLLALFSLGSLQLAFVLGQNLQNLVASCR